MERRHIDLFSGIGGFALAAHWAGYQTEVFCEQDEFCQKVLSRHWPTVPIVSDIHDFDGSAHTGADLLTGGFPCQPFSTAGKRKGDQDDHFLWPEMLRVISEARPTWIVGENVAGLISMALDGVLSDLENEGYSTQAFVIPDCAVNAHHRRDRCWILATHSECRPGTQQERQYKWAENLDGGQSNRLEAWDALADSESDAWKFQSSQWKDLRDESAINGKKRINGSIGRFIESGLGHLAHGLPGRLVGHFDTEPAHIPRVAARTPHRSAKLKAIGNAIVPQVAYEILQCIHPIIETAKWK